MKTNIRSLPVKELSNSATLYLFKVIKVDVTPAHNNFNLVEFCDILSHGIICVFLMGNSSKHKQLMIANEEKVSLNSD